MNSKQEPRSGRPLKKSNNYVSQNRKPDDPPPQNPPPKKPLNNGLAGLVAEYLDTTSCTKALEAFKAESQRPRPGFDKSALLGMFDSGTRDLFFTKLNKCVPAPVRDTNDHYKKLEFYLQVYFFAVKRTGSTDQASLQHFVNYLDTRGQELSQTTELLPYFALPYMPRPAEHPAIEHIFRKKWISDLRQNLSSFLDQAVSQRKPCRLEQLYSDSQRPQTQNQPPPSDRQQQLYASLAEHKQKYLKLQENYREMAELAKANLLDSQSKWFALARDLVSISNRFMKTVDKNGLMTPPLKQLSEKLSKYEIFLSSNIDDLIAHSNNGISLFQQPSVSDIDNHQAARNRTSLNLLSLDYDRIKQYLLRTDQDEPVALLLQALRWRITKTRDSYSRREIIMGYTVHDMMGVNQPQLLQRLLDTQSEVVKEQSLRLANVIASDFYGRSYIIENNTLLDKLVRILKEEDYDGVIRRYALNALQKVSLRSSAQLFMIERGIIRWIAQTLKLEKDDLSETSMQYLTALLMNVTLKKCGKQKCEKEQMIQLLIDLLEIEEQEVRSFVCGSIYSLIMMPKIREEALRIKLPQQLEKYLQNQPQHFAKQVSYILQKIENGADEDEGEGDEEENDFDDIDEEDDDEQDEDEEEELVGDGDVGEDLLIKRFSCVGPEAVRQECLTRSILDEAVKKNLEISIIKQKKTNRSFTTGNVFKPTTPAKSSLEILEAMQEKPVASLKPTQNYDSNNYLPNYVSFKKPPANSEQHEQISKGFAARPLIPRTPPQVSHRH